MKLYQAEHVFCGMYKRKFLSNGIFQISDSCRVYVEHGFLHVFT